MKKLSVILLMLFCAQFAVAQTYNTKLGGAKKVVFQVSKSDLWIEAYDGGEIVIEAKGYEKPPARAEGLKPLYNTAVDNTGIGLEMHNEGGEIVFRKASAKRSTNYKVKVPKKLSVSIVESNWSSHDFTVKGIQGEIEIKGKGSDITIIDVTGPIVAHTTSGDVEVTYTSVKPDQPNSISATSGYVDVTLPKNVKANLIMSAISGEVYTDFTLEYGNNMPKDGKDKKDGHKHDDDCCDGWKGGNKIAGKINGGGVEIALKAISGNIYLRKAK